MQIKIWNFGWVNLQKGRIFKRNFYKIRATKLYMESIESLDTLRMKYNIKPIVLVPEIRKPG